MTTAQQRSVHFVIPGLPEPRREPPIGRRGPYAHPGNETYYDRVRWAWRAAGSVDFGIDPIELSVVAHFPRPITHWRKGGHLTPSGERNPHKVSRPDLSNLIKAIEDALNGLAYHDDSQIVAYGRPRKVWTVTPTDPACVHVAIRALAPNETEF